MVNSRAVLGPSPQACLDRFFFALKPPELLARSIAEFGRSFGGEWIRPDRLHMTVAISGDYRAYPSAYVETLLRVGDRIAAAPCRVKLRQLVQSEQSLLLLPDTSDRPFREIYDCIDGGMRGARAPLRRNVGYAPHMTLSYRDALPFQRRIDGFAWDADEVLLIHSLVGRTKHRCLKSWKLAGSPPPSQYTLL
jgi:2'-5' RNA ligase